MGQVRAPAEERLSAREIDVLELVAPDDRRSPHSHRAHESPCY